MLDLTWRMQRAKDALAEGVEIVKFLTNGIPVIPVLLIMGGFHVADKAFIRIDHEHDMQTAVVAAQRLGEGQTMPFERLSRGHYRLAEQVDNNAWLVYALIPGGGRDIPLLVRDVPDEHRSAATFKV